jgi:23S rRNA (cytosine1962-C5)-methyltransferase
MPIKVYLKEGKERPILRGHPWIFSGAIASVQGHGQPGEICDIYGHDRTFLARGYINGRSQIACRILVRQDVAVDGDLFRQRIRMALNYRQGILPPQTDAYRLINAEGDFLPGLTVDVYGKGLVCQFSTAGMERWKGQIVSFLEEVLQPAFIYERSDVLARKEEGLQPCRGALTGQVSSPVEIQEYGHRFLVDIAGGQKTGFFLDQRENRRLFGSLAGTKQVCDCFCYTGAFSVYAAAGARSLAAVDSSQEALELARKNLLMNATGNIPMDFIGQDVFEYLRQSPGPFDLMVVDPPPFARKKADVPSASRGYKDVNLLALKTLAPGGMLLTFSCSRAIDQKLFGQIVFAAAVDAGREVRIIGRLGLPADHPVSIFHPQGEYLKGLVLHVQ